MKCCKKSPTKSQPLTCLKERKCHEIRHKGLWKFPPSKNTGKFFQRNNPKKNPTKIHHWTPKSLPKTPKSYTLPETNSKRPLKIRPSQKERIIFQPSMFSCENVKLREGILSSNSHNSFPASADFFSMEGHRLIPWPPLALEARRVAPQ